MTQSLAPHLARTLPHVARNHWRSTAAIYHRIANKTIGQSAISNRLADLHQLGLVEFEKRGKWKFWRRVK